MPTVANADISNPPAANPKPLPVRTRAEVCQPAAYRNECRLRAVQSGDFRYEREARGLVTQFRLTPPDIHGSQRQTGSEFIFAPLPHTSLRIKDVWGNNLLETRHERVQQHLTFVAEMTVLKSGGYDTDGRILPEPIMPSKGTQEFLKATVLTEPNDELRNAAETVRGNLQVEDRDDPFALAFALSEYVFRTMRFQSGITGTRTTAVQAWQGKVGVCQDYTHILLALYRLSGIPARYISGFLPGEGAMHAWAEVCLEGLGGNTAWYALDPTHNRWVNERYVTVAFGRDYHDILPTSGTYYGGASVLSHRSRVVVEQTRRLENEE